MIAASGFWRAGVSGVVSGRAGVRVWFRGARGFGCGFGARGVRMGVRGAQGFSAGVSAGGAWTRK